MGRLIVPCFLLLLAPALSAAQPGACEGRLLEATGEHRVARWSRDFLDPDRAERFVDGERRRYSVTFHYPTLAAARLVPYAEGLYAEAVAAAWPVPADFGRSFCVALAESGSPASAGGRFPVILFSPGLSWPPIAYSSLLIDLASRGYIVGAVSHPHAIAKTVFADGSTVDMSRWPPIADEARRQEFLAEYLETWIADLHHLAGEIESGVAFAAGPLERRADLSAGIGLLGHSYGASAVARALDGVRFRVALAMEGRYRGPEPPPLSPKGVLMHLVGGYNRGELEGGHYRADRHPLYEVIVHGAGHSSFSDLVLLYADSADEDWRRRHQNEIVPSRALQIVRAYAGAFFDGWLKGRDSAYLHPVSNTARFDSPARAGFPEVELNIDVMPRPLPSD